MRALLLPFFFSTCLLAADQDGFTPLIRGDSLAGWVNVNCAPETWTVKDGLLTCTGKPTGALRTEAQYENFIFECEWRHLNPGGNAGIFIWAGPIAAPGVPFLRAIEVQVLDHGYGQSAGHTTHGDVFPIHGSTMAPFGRHNGMRSFPSEERSKPSPEWNHYRIEAIDGVLRLSVNGKEVSGGEKCMWRKGYLALESEGGRVEWRNLRLKALPPSGAKPDETAPLAEGHRSLYSGLDLRGWKIEAPARWKAADWTLKQSADAPAQPLVSEEQFGDCQVIFDFHLPADAKSDTVNISLRGIPLTLTGQRKVWTRATIEARGKALSARIEPQNNQPAHTVSASLETAPPKAPLALIGSTDSRVQFANIYVRDLPAEP